jgi:hypothetical protein
LERDMATRTRTPSLLNKDNPAVWAIGIAVFVLAVCLAWYAAFECVDLLLG